MKTRKKIITGISITAASILLLTGCSNPDNEKEFSGQGENKVIEKDTSKSISNADSGVAPEATPEQKEIHKFILSYFDEMVNTSSLTAKELNYSDNMIKDAVGKDSSAELLMGNPLTAIPKLNKEQQQNLSDAFEEINHVAKYNAKNIEDTSDLALFNMMNTIYNSMFGMILETGINSVAFSLPTDAITFENEDNNKALVDATRMTLQTGETKAIVSDLSNINQIPLIKEKGKWLIDSSALMNEYKRLIDETQNGQ